MSEINEHVESRLKKLSDLKDLGVEPFGGAFEFSDHAEDLHSKYGDKTSEVLQEVQVRCTLAGRIIMLRSFGKAAFAHIRDTTGSIQIYMKKDQLKDEFSIVKKLDIGDIVGVEGHLFRTKTNELTVEVERLTFLTKAVRPLPEKWHGLKDIEIRYRQRYVDLIVNPEVKDAFRKRSVIIKAVRDFLESHGFIEVETPMMQQIPGGGDCQALQDSPQRARN